MLSLNPDRIYSFIERVLEEERQFRESCKKIGNLPSHFTEHSSRGILRDIFEIPVNKLKDQESPIQFSRESMKAISKDSIVNFLIQLLVSEGRLTREVSNMPSRKFPSTPSSVKALLDLYDLPEDHKMGSKMGDIWTSHIHEYCYFFLAEAGWHQNPDEIRSALGTVELLTDAIVQKRTFRRDDSLEEICSPLTCELDS